MRAIRRFTVRTALPESIAALGELASNLHWSWDISAQGLFASIDERLWLDVGKDPLLMLSEVSSARFEELSVNSEFVDRVGAEASKLHAYLNGDRWYQDGDPQWPSSIAYFSPEFGITQALPQYSGGLGILAGDHLKAASDLGVPIIGVGLFYGSGYFRQSLSAEGWQQETYPVLDPDGLPLSVLREDDGLPVQIVLEFPEGDLVSLVRVAQVGRVPLLLLDSDVDYNTTAMRGVTDKLYGGNTDHRLRQEMLLGIGGVRAIRAFCRLSGHVAPQVFHTNEGHAGFLGVERIRELVEKEELSFDAALEAVRAGTVFTTHTPVPDGIDRFDRDLIAAVFDNGQSIPGVDPEQILALGAETFPDGDPELFNMAVMGLRIASRANGVSELHGRVSREMFAGLWPHFDPDDIPITSITNGVHGATWLAARAAELIRSHGGASILDAATGWEQLADISDEELWAAKRELRQDLVLEARRRLRESWHARGVSDIELNWIDNVLDPDVLTIGFARRVPSYKRLTLMLRDRDRLAALLTDPERPVQIVVAGKAHPDDDGGKKLVQDLVEFADEVGIRDHMVFLPDYDIGMAQLLYPGCDVWLNNPLRPLEACGTSGMKAALNGALNVSIRDGWWDEWFDGNNGWAIPTADGVLDPDRRDDLESAALYDLLEQSVTARFYEVGANGVPIRWVEMVRHTLATLGPKVLASRMVRDYVVKLYGPAAVSSRAAAIEDFALARELAQWKAAVRAAWPMVSVDHVDAHGLGDEPQRGGQFAVSAEVTLGELLPQDVHVQLIYGRVDAEDRILGSDSEDLDAQRPMGDGRWVFGGQVPLDRTGPFGYTVRVVPAHRGLTTPAELGLVATPQSVARTD